MIRITFALSLVAISTLSSQAALPRDAATADTQIQETAQDAQTDTAKPGLQLLARKAGGGQIDP
jgi:hypothetical protein